jgi:hypothetical protein
MKCLQCKGAEIGVDARSIDQHARAVHNQSLAEWKQMHEKLSASYPEDEALDPDVDEAIAEALERKKLR